MHDPPFGQGHIFGKRVKLLDSIDTTLLKKI
jgi:hypothetical protein